MALFLPRNDSTAVLSATDNATDNDSDSTSQKTPLDPSPSSAASKARPGNNSLIGPWIALILAVCFLVLTVIFTSQSALTTGIRFIYDSSSNTIFVFSLLAGINGLLLGVSISSAFELLQWLLLARFKGVQLTTFLALHSSTGVLGLLSLASGRGEPTFSGVRAWAVGRLLTTALIPVLGVLIMSNVNTKMAFHDVDTYSPAMGWGMTQFNASLARNISIISDHLIQVGLDTFLDDPTHGMDLTPAHLRTIPCSYNPGSYSGVACQRKYFLAGVEFMPPVLDNSTSEAIYSQVLLARDQQGYILEFKEQPGNMTFDRETECEIFGFPFASVGMCIRNVEKNVIEAQITGCPPTLSIKNSCQTSKSSTWLTNPGWRTQLTLSFQNATIAYSRLNGSVTSYQLSQSTPIPAPIDAQNLLQAYRNAFGTNHSLIETLAVWTDPKKTTSFPFLIYPAYVAAHLQSVKNMGYQQRPAVQNRAAAVLRCVLATALYHAQPSLFARALASVGVLGAAEPEPEPELLKFRKDMLALAPPTTIVSIAQPRFQVVVGRATLVAYLTLACVALSLCAAVLVYTSLSALGRGLPPLTVFPLLDAAVRCRHRRGDDVVESVFASGSVLGSSVRSDGRQRRLVEELSRVRVGIGRGL